MESDVPYFRRRAAQEHAAASQAVDAFVARVHREMAARYMDLADAIEAQQRDIVALTQVTDPVSQPANRLTLWL